MAYHKSRMIVCLDVEAIEIDEWGTIRNVSRYRIVWHLACTLPYDKLFTRHLTCLIQYFDFLKA